MRRENYAFGVVFTALAVVLVVLLAAGCGGNDDEAASPGPGATAVAEEPEPEPTSAPAEEPEPAPVEEPTAPPGEDPPLPPVEGPFTTYAVAAGDFEIAVPSEWTVEKDVVTRLIRGELIEALPPRVADLVLETADHPLDLKFLSFEPATGASLSVSIMNQGDYDVFPLLSCVDVLSEVEGVDLEQRAAEWDEWCELFGGVPVDVELITLPAGDAMRVEFELAPPGGKTALSFVQYEFPRDGQSYVITTAAISDAAPHYAPIFERSLESFRFTEALTGAEAGEKAMVDADQWTGDVCAATVSYIQGEMKRLEEFAEDAPSMRDIADQRRGFLALLDDAIELTDGVIAEIEGAGIPVVESGEAIQREILAWHYAFRALAMGTRGDIEAVSPGDPDAEARLEEISEHFAEGGRTIFVMSPDEGIILGTFEDFEARELRDAYKREPACQELDELGP